MIDILNMTKLIEDWNNKLNGLADKYLNNVGIGTVIFGLLLVGGCWAVSYLTKK